MKCPICGKTMIWYMDTLLCPKCDAWNIWELNPNTICQDYVKRFKNGKN